MIDTKKQSATPNAEGLKEGISCCMPMENEVNVGSFRADDNKRPVERVPGIEKTMKERIRESVPDRRARRERIPACVADDNKQESSGCVSPKAR